MRALAELPSVKSLKIAELTSSSIIHWGLPRGLRELVVDRLVLSAIGPPAKVLQQARRFDLHVSVVPPAAAPSSAAAPGRPASPLPSSSAAAPSVPARPASGFGTASTGTVGTYGGANRPGMFGSSTYGSGYGTGGYGTGGYGSTYGSNYGSSYGGGYNSPYSSSYGSGYNSGYGGYNSPYSSGYSSYSSPYSRFGSYNSPYSSYSSFNRPYGSMYGSNYYSNGMNDPNALSRNMEQSTAAAFGVLENIVFAFQGLSGMLESTFHATHSSFMAMMSLIDQFGNLRNMLGGFLGLFGLVRFLRDSVYWLLGRDPPVRELTPDEFAEWERSGETVLPDGTVAPGQKPLVARANRKPFLLFFLFAIGIPWIFSRLVRFLQEQQLKRERRALEAAAARGDPNAKAILEGRDPAELGLGPDGQPLPGLAGPPGAPGKLVFAKAKHAFEPQSPQELALERGEIVAVLNKVRRSASFGARCNGVDCFGWVQTDPATGQTSEWWRGRTRDGRMGFFPGSYVEELPDPSSKPAPRPASSGSERTAAPAGSPGGPAGSPGGAPDMSVRPPSRAASAAGSA
ncbi:Peroxin 13, N-terminal region-domain-containing protein, partial [Hyaloraphidium curvatum]